MKAKTNLRLVKEKKSDAEPFAYKVTRGVISVDGATSVRDVARTLAKHKIGAVIVKSNTKLVGIVSERDIAYRVVAQGKSHDDTKAKDIMTKKVATINLDDGINSIHERMKKAPFRHLPVRKGKEIIGMISNRDLMYLHKLRAIHCKK